MTPETAARIFEPGRGATCTVLLPTSAEQLEAAPEVRVGNRLPLAGASVVVVEDDGGVRQFVAVLEKPLGADDLLERLLAVVG